MALTPHSIYTYLQPIYRLPYTFDISYLSLLDSEPPLSLYCTTEYTVLRVNRAALPNHQNLNSNNHGTERIKEIMMTMDAPRRSASQPESGAAAIKIRSYNWMRIPVNNAHQKRVGIDRGQKNEADF